MATWRTGERPEDTTDCADAERERAIDGRALPFASRWVMAHPHQDSSPAAAERTDGHKVHAFPGPTEDVEMPRTPPWKYLWAAPCTAVGALCGLLLCAAGASARHVAGVVEVAFDDKRRPAARLIGRLPFSAITLGHVVLAHTHACHAVVRAHERVHVAQYERWGLLFFALYAGSSAWQLLCGRRPYIDNHFERQARRLAGDATG